MKYIDAEKLKAELKGKIAEVESEPAPADRETTLLQMCKINAFREVLSVIKRIEKTSLQQEQSEKKEVKFVFPKFLYARTLDNKTIDVSYVPQSMEAIEYARNDSVEEQPEVDLEKEYTEFVESDPVYSKLVNNIVGKAIARHFAEWGIRHLNARKEENK